MRALSRTAQLLVPLLLTLQGAGAFAADASPPIANKHLLSNAVQLQITPRGMQFFDTKLTKILGNLGVNLDEGYFPAMKYTFTNPVNIGDISKDNPEIGQMYNQVRALLSQWFVGFSLNDHRPQIEIGDSGYLAEFSRFGLVTDEALMRTLGKNEGAVLAIELEVKKLTVSTKSVVAWDVNNEFLGKLGMEDVTMQVAGGAVPLKMRLPFYVHMNSDGTLDFQALEITNNLDQVDVALQYKKLLVPTFAIVVNGKQFVLNNDEVDKFFTKEAPVILNKVRGSLGDFARKQLPDMLNQKAKEMLTGSLEQVQDMAAPGKEDNDTRPDFKWGLKLQNINLKNSLNVDLTSYVEDTTNVVSQPRKTDAARGPVSMALLPQTDFDIALSIDRSLINRILQLSFERKNFEKIDMGDGTTMKLMTSPLIDYIKAPVGVTITNQETWVKLNISVDNQPDSIFLKNTIVLNFDIIAKLRQLPDKSGMNLVLYKIDENSMSMDDQYFSLAGRLLKNKVRDGIKAKLVDKCKTWTTKETTIDGSFPLPPKVLGIKLNINRVVMDQTGHLVMYLDYAKKGGK